MKKKISIKDVAQEAGVSPSAVSAVLNNKVGKGIRVGKESQEKIQEAARKLGYVPNPAAQNLVSGKSHILSIFSYEAAFPFEAESEFYEFLLGIEKTAEKTGFDILLLTNKQRHSNGAPVDLNRLKLGDGGILIGIERHTDVLLRLIDDNFPLVFIGRRDMEGRQVNMVNYDYKNVIENLVRLACEKGHTRCRYLRNSENSEPYSDRQDFLDRAWEISGRGECLSVKTEGITDSMIRDFLNEEVSLLFLERKELAIQLEKTCEDMGLTLGEDISAVLLEDQWFTSNVKWTCWSNERIALGMEAVNLLLDVISGKTGPSEARLILPELHPGETLGNR